MLAPLFDNQAHRALCIFPTESKAGLKIGVSSIPRAEGESQLARSHWQGRPSSLLLNSSNPPMVHMNIQSVMFNAIIEMKSTPYLTALSLFSILYLRKQARLHHTLCMIHTLPVAKNMTGILERVQNTLD